MAIREPTRIGWCRGWTVNPWHGCDGVSAACEHCYAQDQDHRWGKDCHGESPRLIRVEKAIRELWRIDTWLQEQEQAGSVFVMSMGDLFEDRPELAGPRAQFLRAMRWCTRIDFLILTKRPENLVRMVREMWPDSLDAMPFTWWLGTTVENAAVMGDRLRELRLAAEDLGSVVPLRTFVSVEPMLSDLPLISWYLRQESDWLPRWVICGCERVHGNRPGRPMNPVFADALARDCAVLGVPFFLKQFSGLDGMVTTDLSQWVSDAATARREFPDGLRRLDDACGHEQDTKEVERQVG